MEGRPTERPSIVAALDETFKKAPKSEKKGQHQHDLPMSRARRVPACFPVFQEVAGTAWDTAVCAFCGASGTWPALPETPGDTILSLILLASGCAAARRSSF